MPSISIIIPVYNTAEYLPKCLNSVLQQTLNDIEIICVNDGSTDGSLSILEEYAKKDKRITIINKTKGGPLSARKAGIEKVTTEYVGFVDSDDYIDDCMFQEMFEIAVENSVDIVLTGYKLEGLYTTTHFDSLKEGIHVDDIQHIRENCIFNKKELNWSMNGSVWSRIFKTSLIRPIMKCMPSNLDIAEDRACFIRCLLSCNSLYFIKKAYYHYVIRESSLSHKGDSEYPERVGRFYNYMKSQFSHPNCTDSVRKQIELYVISLLVSGINIRMGFENKNLLRIDPVWMKEIPKSAKVLFYGGGELGDQYKRQLSNMRKDVTIIKDCGFEMPAYDDFVGCDVVVIGIKNEERAMEVKAAMIVEGIPESKILWTPQPEFFWKYAEAEGLFN